VFVVPPDDPALVRLLDATSSLQTSGGNIRARWAVLRTPLGVRRGLVAPDSPRLMPGGALRDLHVDYKTKTVQAHDEQGQPLECGMWRGHPCCHHTEAERQVRKARKAARRTDHPAPPIYRPWDSTSLTEREKDSRAAGDTAARLGYPVDRDVSRDAHKEQKQGQVLPGPIDAAPQAPAGASKHEKPGKFAGAKAGPAPQNEMQHACTHFPKKADCEVCQRSKAQFPGHRRVNEEQRATDRATKTGERLVGDLCTPWPTAPRGENTLFCLLDEHSELVGAFPLLGKLPGGVKEALLRFRNWMRKVRQETGESTPLPWFFKRDQGGEFEDLDIRDWIADQYGIEETVPTGRHVAQAERLVRTTAEGVRALLSASGLPAVYWSFAAIMYFWNANLRHAGWRAMCEKHRYPAELRILGQLCYVKLDPSVYPLDKSEDAARPCAFLSWSLRARYGAFVLFINKEGKYATTMVDRRGLFFPDTAGMPIMAFDRVFRDLKTLSVPGPELGPATEPLTDIAAEAAALDFRTPAPAGGGRGTQDKPSWVRPLSQCPACRGRAHRNHTYQGSDPQTKCRWSGLNKERLQTGRSMGRKVPPERRDVLLEEAGMRTRAGEQWPAVKTWLEGKFAEARQAAPQPADPEGAGVHADAAQLPGREAQQPQGPRSRDYWSYEGDRIIRVHVEPRTTLFTPRGVRGAPDVTTLTPDRSTKVRFVDKRRKALELADTWNGDTRHRDLGASWVGETTFTVRVPTDPAAHATNVDCSYSSAQLTHPDELDSDRLCARAYLTRKMTKSEKNSTIGKRALQLEIDKLIEYGCLGVPVSRRSITDQKATLSGLVLLASVKHAEKPEAEWRFKGRAVVLGNRVILVHSRDSVGGSDEITGHVAWAEMRSELASLDEGRVVDVWSVLHGYDEESIDFENGYLQKRWPTDWPQHYLQIPRELWPMLPKSHQPKADMVEPVFPMLKCLYGHPASGHLFVNEVQDFLEKGGWVSIGRAGSRTLMVRERTVLVLYVDDCKASGPWSELSRLWSELRGRFVFAPEQATSAFLGQRVTRTVTGDYVELCVDMSDYCATIVRTYEELWGAKVKHASVPIVADLRAFAESDKKPPTQAVMKMVGMILWLARSYRSDLGYVASALGTRVSSWNADCEVELARCVGYIAATQALRLRQRWRAGTPWELRLYTDSDWRAPRSQSGFLLAIEPQGQEPGGDCSLILAFGSRKQPFCAESVAAAESVACYLGLREALPVHWAFGQCAHRDGGPLRVFVDNSQVVSLARNGHSESLEFIHKAVNVRTGSLKDAGQLGWVRVCKIRTEYNRANLLTKPVKPVDIRREREMAGLVAPA